MGSRQESEAPFFGNSFRQNDGEGDELSESKHFGLNHASEI